MALAVVALALGLAVVAARTRPAGTRMGRARQADSVDEAAVGASSEGGEFAGERNERPREDAARAALPAARAALMAAESRVAAAGAARARASQADADARKEVAAATARIAGLREGKRSAESRRDAARSQLRPAFPEEVPPDHRHQIERRQQEVNEAEVAAREATEAREQAATRHHQAEAALRQIEGEEQRLGTRLADTRAALETRRKDLQALGPRIAAAPAADEPLAKALAAVRKWCDGLIAEGTRFAEACADERAAKIEAMREVLRAASVEAGGDDPAEIRRAADETEAAAKRAAERARQEADDMQRRLAARREHERVIGEKRAEASLYGRLAAELREDRFMTFLLRESLEQLALQASIELTAISGGRYQLKAVNSHFHVIDHFNADEDRTVHTLSGGETFLASLALALALSTGLTALAGHTAASRLEAVFIDEGFGSLDPETLDVVIDALEGLSAGERMVGVITHVPALAERISAGLRVERTATGSRVAARAAT
jgi:exonuclease SbcC